jgi:hypothetical protein
MIRTMSNTFNAGRTRLFPWVSLLAALLLPTTASAAIDGIVPANGGFTLNAKAGYVSLADGGSIYSWGYTTGDTMQLPGPTLIVTQGSTITVTLNNTLPAAAGNVSIVFPGHEISNTTGGVPGQLTQEAPPGGSVTYTFTADQPGTYQYHSGTQPDLQVEMGLYGALIVLPSTVPIGCTAVPVVHDNGEPDRRLAASAYSHPSTCYDREFLYVLSEIDIDVHNAAELQAGGTGPIQLPSGAYHSEYWLMNGRVGPDTMAEPSIPGQGVLPTQPYGSLTRMHPGERLLIRLVGAGREMHPFHHHGNHSRLLAVDGQMLLNSSGNLAGPLLFTIPSIPGQTADAIFEWTGKDLGWDMYGIDAEHEHSCNGISVTDPNLQDKTSAGFDPVTHEYCPDHGKELPVTLPDLTNLTFGGFYSGSPYLGLLGSLPPGEGGLNPGAGFAYMWHSHTERELVNNDVFPGGMMTMMIVEAPWVPIE